MLNWLVTILLLLNVLHNSVTSVFTWVEDIKYGLLIIVLLSIIFKVNWKNFNFTFRGNELLILVCILFYITISSLISSINTSFYELAVSLSEFILYIFIIIGTKEKVFSLRKIIFYNFLVSIVLYILWEMDFFRSIVPGLTTIGIINNNALSFMLLSFIIISNFNVYLKSLLTVFTLFISIQLNAGGTIIVGSLYIISIALVFLFKRMYKYLILITLNLSVIATIYLSVNEIFFIGDINIDNALTNRISLWSTYTIEVFSSAKNLIFGVGDTTLLDTSILGVLINNPHSMYVTLLFENGILLLVIFMIFINFLVIKYTAPKYVLFFLILSFYGLIYPMELGNFHAYGLYYLFSILLLTQSSKRMDLID